MMEKLLVLSNGASDRVFSMCGGLKSLTVCCFQRSDSLPPDIGSMFTNVGRLKWSQFSVNLQAAARQRLPIVKFPNQFHQLRQPVVLTVAHDDRANERLSSAYWLRLLHDNCALASSGSSTITARDLKVL